MRGWWRLIGLMLVLCFGVWVNGFAQPIVIKAVTAFPKNHLNNDPVPIFLDKVNSRLKGVVEIKWLGGPEVVDTYEQPRALQSGAVDMVLYSSFGYLKPLMPEAYAKSVSELTEWEERKSGAHALWEEIFAKRLNSKYLGTFHSYVPFVLYSNKKIQKAEDMKGLRVRAMPLYVPFLKAMGAIPVTIAPGDIYTAMERKVVDAFIWPQMGMISWGLQEVTKYQIIPGFYRMEPWTAINLNKWNAIPKEAQRVIEEIMEDMEYIATMRAIQVAKYEDEVRIKAGMQFVEIQPSEAERFLKIIYEETWKAIVQESPEYGPRLRQLTSKKALPKGAFPWM